MSTSLSRNEQPTTEDQPTTANLITQVPSPDTNKPSLVQRSSERPTPQTQNSSVTKPESIKSPRNQNSGKFRKGGILGLFFCCTAGSDGYNNDSDRAGTPKTDSLKLVPVGSKRQQPSVVEERPVVTTTVNAQGGTSTSGSSSDLQPADNDAVVGTGSGLAGPVTAPGTPETEPTRLLGPISPEDEGRKCLVLDLDETLVHSSFKIIHQADFIVPVEIDNLTHNVYVIKRPGVDEFLRRMGDLYEIVVFTASLSKYADPVLDMLDIHRVVRHRLFRESCYNHKGNYVKDLSQVGRDLTQTIIIDNSPASYIFHVNNAVPVSSWFNDPHDTELLDLIPFLDDLTGVPDVTMVLDTSNLPPEAAEGA